MLIPRSCYSFLLTTTCVFLTMSVFAGPGTKIYNELVDSEGFYEEGGWDEYVAELGAKLATHSSDSKRKLHFFVVDSPGVNAFATPDGYIFVNRGLLMFLESEDQLAAVIGHEIGHIVARHGAKQRWTDILGLYGGFVGTILTGRREMMDLADESTKALIAGYGREMELEADAIGAEILARAGYNPLAIIESLQVLKDQSLYAAEVRGQPATYHGLFATHPQNDKRLHDIVNYATQSVPETLIDPIDDFWTLLDGMKFGSDATSGMLEQHIYFDKTARLVIEFPEDWFVTYNQSEVNGQATGGPKVAWARITRHARDDHYEPSVFVRDTLKRSDIKEEETVSVNGRDAYLVRLEIAKADEKEKKDKKDKEESGNENEEEAKVEIGLLGLVELNQHVYAVRGQLGEQGDAGKFEEDFMKILAGIRDMRPTDLKEDISIKLKVIVADPGVTYEQLAENGPLRGRGAEILRLLNGDYPRGEPRAGDYIKTVE